MINRYSKNSRHSVISTILSKRCFVDIFTLVIGLQRLQVDIPLHTEVDPKAELKIQM